MDSLVTLFCFSRINNVAFLNYHKLVLDWRLGNKSNVPRNGRLGLNFFDSVKAFIKSYLTLETFVKGQE